MTDSHVAAAGQPCPLCGTTLIAGTIDLADEPAGTDEPRNELDPGHMVQAIVCPNRECPGPESGAQL